MKKLAWFIRQLFPLWYHTTYSQCGKKYATWWKMWFGKVYKHELFEVLA